MGTLGILPVTLQSSLASKVTVIAGILVCIMVGLPIDLPYDASLIRDKKAVWISSMGTLGKRVGGGGGFSAQF